MVRAIPDSVVRALVSDYVKPMLEDPLVERFEPVD
jgi:hypothetical protein